MNTKSLLPKVGKQFFDLFISCSTHCTLLSFLLIMPACVNEKKHKSSHDDEQQKLLTILKRIDSTVYSDPRKAIALAAEMVREAEAQGDWDKVGQGLQTKALAYNILEKPDSAIIILHQAQSINDQISDKLVWGQILGELGRAYRLLNNKDSSKYYFESVEELAQQQDDLRLKMFAANGLAIVYSDLGYKGKAYDQYLKALNYSTAMNDRQNMAITLNNLALIDADMKQYDLAEQRYREAIAINKKTHHYFDLAMNYGNLALMFETIKQYDSALIYHDKSLSLAREKGYIRELARALLNSSNIYIQQKIFDKAKIYLAETVELCHTNGILIGLYHSYKSLAMLERSQGNYKQAIEYLDKANHYAKVLDNLELKSDVMKLYSETYQALSDYKKAYSHLVEHHRLKDTLTNIANAKHIVELQTRYETEKKVTENEYLRRENEAQQQRVRLLNVVIIVVGVALLVSFLLVVLQLRYRRRLRKFYKQLSILNNEVSHKNMELLLANQTKNELFSIIAHDLRSPFNTLIGLFEIITRKDKYLSDNQRDEVLVEMYKQIVYTFGTLDNLLQWSMSNQNLITRTDTLFALRQAVQEELEGLGLQASEKQITLHNLVEASICMNSDPNLLKTVVRNLVNNAIKFSHPGSSIMIRSDFENDSLRLSIIDHGVGMSAEYLEKLLKTESTTSTRGTSNEKGTGLGTKLLIDFSGKLNAKLQIKSEPGKGTAVSLIFRPEDVAPMLEAQKTI